MEADIFQLLDGLGNVGVIAACMLLWKVDKRISRLEWEIFEKPKGCNHG